MRQVVKPVRPALALVLAVYASLAAPAAAYVRTTTETSGAAVQWDEQCVVVTIDLRGSKDVALADIATTLARAVGNWTRHTSACNGIVL